VEKIMSGSSKFQKTLTVGLSHHATSGLFALTSDDLPGLLLAGKDPAKLWDDVPAVVKALYKVSGMDVSVEMEPLPADLDDDHLSFNRVHQATFLKVMRRDAAA
jgi:hypothetical protein